MEQTEIKQKAIKGVFWSFCERFGSLIILFSANIVLARMLTPEEFGLIGLLMAFILFFNILIDGGLGNALIQRKNLSKEDCSTIFYTNIIISVICFCLLFGGAEQIMEFFNQKQDYAIILRILSSIIIIDAFSAVQQNLLIKNLNFKRLTIIKISVAAISSAAAIIAACSGLGVWSLAIQYITNSIIKSILLWSSSNWGPSFIFSRNSFNELFKFGSKILFANLLSEGYRNFQVLIIGKFFPASEVGYFSQAKHLQEVPVTTSITIVNQVTFPIFSQLQDNLQHLVNGVRRSIKILTFINFPLILILIITARPIFMLLYGSKWLAAVPYFQWLCGGFGFLLVIHNTNLNVIKALGRSDIVLYLEIVKKILGLSFIFLFIWLGYGVIGILWALTINSIIEFFLNGYFTGKYTSYGISAQIMDILPNLINSVIAGGITYFIGTILNLHYLLLLVVLPIVFCITYYICLKIFKNETYHYILNEVKKKIHTK